MSRWRKPALQRGPSTRKFSTANNPPRRGGGDRATEVFVLGLRFDFLTFDLASDALPGPRLKPAGGVVMVPAYTDLKLHDITTGSADPNADPLDQNQPAGSAGFFAGNRKFITRKLWGLYNQGPFMLHGGFTTMREAIENHNGEALASRRAFDGLSPPGRDDLIEFLKSLRVRPPGAKSLTVDPEGNPKRWPQRQ